MNKILALSNIFVGLLALSLQIAAYAMYSNWDPYKAGAGIWGGIHLFTFGVLLVAKTLKTKRVVTITAVIAMLIGITLIGLYSWSIDLYQDAISNCNLVPELKICDKVAIDSLMIISGILAFIINGIIATKASSFASS